MKKMLIVLLFGFGGYCYGMIDQKADDNERNPTAILGEVTQRVEDQLETITTTAEVPVVLDVGKYLDFEGKCWWCFARFLQPLQIVASAAGVCLSTSAAIYSETDADLSRNLAIASGFSSVASGVMGVFLTKMNNRVKTIEEQLKALQAQHNPEV